MVTNSVIKEGIYRFVEVYGPVDMREILVGGRRTGYLKSGHDDEEIVSIIHVMLDTKELEYTSQHRLKVTKEETLQPEY